MPEPVTTVGVAAIAAYLGKDGLQKLLGPTCEYLGDGLRLFAEKRMQNVGSIFKAATDRLGADIEKPGQVPPKVLKGILSDGSYSDDPLTLEYFGGVLASSRSEIGRDDRGARISQTIERMSAYQLRAHFIFYGCLIYLRSGSSNVFSADERMKLGVFVAMDRWVSAMQLNDSEISSLPEIASHVMFGLAADQLIDSSFKYGPEIPYYADEEMKSGYGLSVRPTIQGLELFSWAHGSGREGIESLFSEKFRPKLDVGLIESCLPRYLQRPELPSGQ